MNAPTILTGDRPTGPLHLGHFVGSLRQRVALQQTHSQFVLIADLQGLTDNGSNPQNPRQHPRSAGRLPRRGHRPEPDYHLPAVRPARPRRADDAVYEHRHRRPR